MTAEIELTLAGSHAGAGVPSFSGPVFSGPFDLLLAIVRRNGYPLDRLPLAEITRQYTTYLEQHREQMEQDELELGAEFFDTASWLVLLKSRALLPGREAAPAEELRQALVAHGEVSSEQVAEMKGFLAGQLDQLGMAAGGAELPAGLGDGSSLVDTLAPEKVPTVHDAVLSARQALATARAHAAATAAAEAGVAMAEVLSTLDRRLATLAPGVMVSTAPWFAGLDRETRSVLLLALLELARLGVLWVYQAAPGAALWIQRPLPVVEGKVKEKRQPRRAAKRLTPSKGVGS